MSYIENWNINLKTDYWLSQCIRVLINTVRYFNAVNTKHTKIVAVVADWFTWDERFIMLFSCIVFIHLIYWPLTTYSSFQSVWFGKYDIIAFLSLCKLTVTWITKSQIDNDELFENGNSLSHCQNLYPVQLLHWRVFQLFKKFVSDNKCQFSFFLLFVLYWIF